MKRQEIRPQVHATVNPRCLLSSPKVQRWDHLASDGRTTKAPKGSVYAEFKTYMDVLWKIGITRGSAEEARLHRKTDHMIEGANYRPFHPVTGEPQWGEVREVSEET